MEWKSLLVGVHAASLLVIGIGLSTASGDEATARYFEQLRSRGLFTLAESYAVGRLSQARLSVERRVELVIELSRTLSTHAEFSGDAPQQELWSRAQATVEDERTRDPDSPFAPVLKAQSALVAAEQAHWLTAECELNPFDEPFAERARRQCTEALRLLTAVEIELAAPPRPKSAEPAPAPTSHDFRTWLHRVRFAQARTHRDRGHLLTLESPGRRTDLDEAEQIARKLIPVADEPLLFQAKLLLAACQRLKREWSRADEMLKVLEETPLESFGDQQELIAERARWNLDRNQPSDALQTIVQARSKSLLLSGELWYLQIQALVAMRDLAANRKEPGLAEKLKAEAELAQQRCAEQVGGYWSRRCEQLWDLTRTAEKFGPELDALMQQARADFLGGNSSSAVKTYERAELAARARQQMELAAELGYTRASILLSEKQYETAESVFHQWMQDYPDDPRVVAAHLNWAYCLGRLYDLQKTQSRRERYTAALDQHLARFPQDPTAHDARFFKAQLEEQRLQTTVALPLYLNVAAEHPRSAEALAGAARCYEIILIRLRDRKHPSGEFEQTAIRTLESFLPASSESVWSVPQAEVAIHLAAILMMSPPPRFEQAGQLLDRALSVVSPVTTGDAAGRAENLRQRAQSLRVIALAGNGQPLEAERLMKTLGNASPRELLGIAEGLAPFVLTEDPQRQAQYVALQVQAMEQLAPHRSRLSAPEQVEVDRMQARAWLASGQIAKAAEIYAREIQAAGRDAARLHEIARQLSEFEHRECQSLARTCWRRLESQSKPGTSDWLVARLGVISTSLNLKETADARKLISLTRVLYPDVTRGPHADRFHELERQAEGR